MTRKKVGLLELTGEEFQKDFEKLLSLGSPKITFLARKLNNEKGFEFRDDEEARKVISKLKVSNEVAQSILKVSKFLYNQASEKNISPSDLILELKKYSKVKNIKHFDIKSQSLKQLFTVNKEFKKFKNREKYIEGVLDNLESISCVFDFRHVFNEKNENDIEAIIPILIIRFRLKDDHDNKKTFSFQVDQKNFLKMLDILKGYEKKLNSLKVTSANYLNLV